MPHYRLPINGVPTRMRSTIQGGAEVSSAPVVPPPTLEPETALLLANLAGSYDTARQTAMNDFIVSLKTDGIWTKLDRLSVVGLNLTDSLLNWKAPASGAGTAINSPTFTADRGFTAAVSGSRYIQTNYNPAVDGVQWEQDSASVGVYCRTNNTETGTDMGGASSGRGTSIRIRNTSGNMLTHVNAIDATPYATGSVTDSLGLFAGNRLNSTNMQAYRNGVLVNDAARTSSLRPNRVLLVGATTASTGTVQSWTNRQYALWFMGAGLTGTEHLAFYNAIQTYMTAIGANV